MALKPEIKAKRDKDIRKRFMELSNKTTAKGKRLMTYEAITEQLGQEFYLSEDTIEKIVYSNR